MLEERHRCKSGCSGTYKSFTAGQGWAMFLVVQGLIFVRMIDLKSKIVALPFETSC